MLDKTKSKSHTTKFAISFDVHFSCCRLVYCCLENLMSACFVKLFIALCHFPIVNCATRPSCPTHTLPLETVLVRYKTAWETHLIARANG